MAIPMRPNSMTSSTGQADALKGTGYRQVQTYTPEQMQLFQQLFGHTSPGGYLSKLAGGDQAAFQQLEAPALQQFQQLQGNVASKFSGAGSGARHSSGFQNTLNQATSDFAQQLQAQRLGLQRQAMQDLMGMSHSLLGQQPYSLIPEQKPFWQELLLSGAGGLGSALGGLGSLFGANILGSGGR